MLEIQWTVTENGEGPLESDWKTAFSATVSRIEK